MLHNLKKDSVASFSQVELSSTPKRASLFSEAAQPQTAATSTKGATSSPIYREHQYLPSQGATDRCMVMSDRPSAPVLLRIPGKLGYQV